MKLLKFLTILLLSTSFLSCIKSKTENALDVNKELTYCETQISRTLAEVNKVLLMMPPTSWTLSRNGN